MLTIRTRLEDERGATIVLMALLLIALLGMSGLVVDLGLVRADRQRNKSAADVAVSAGLQAANIGSGTIGTYQGACAAKTYLQANHPELGSFSIVTWRNGSGTAIPDPCTLPLASPCNEDPSLARASFAWFHGVTTGGLTVDIKAGYDATDMTSDATTYGFADETYHPTDRGAADKYGCDQLAVIVKEQENAGFGKVLGASTLSSRIRSVGRVTVDSQSEDAVALLLLERADCKSLDINGTTTFVEVKGTQTRPGIVHSDSVGSGSCSGSSHVLQGDHANGIVADQAPSGSPPVPGIVSISAIGGANSANAYDSTTNVVAQGSAPIAGTVKGRGPVDSRYLGPASAGTPYGITKMRNDAATAFASSAGYTPYTGAACPPSSIAAGVTRIWLDCNVTTTWTVPTSVTDIVIKGAINLGGATVTIPNARTLYIYGSTTGGNPKGIDLGSGGNLIINNNNITTPSPGSTICEDRRLAAPAATTQMVVGNGMLNAGSTGMLRMCSTTLFMMDGSIPTTTGTVPADNSYKGNVSVTGQGTLEWTAPNQNNTTPPTGPQLKQFEDLAFWSETSASNAIGGTGASVTLKGIFFLPNANPFKMNAGGAGITADAQFITRKLEVSGGGALTMTADPNNSTPFSFLSGFSLVR